MNRCWFLSGLLDYRSRDLEAVEGLKDGVMSGKFEIAGVSTARWRGDIGVSSLMSDSARLRWHVRAQLTSSGHLSVECLGSWRQYRRAKVNSVQVARHIDGAGVPWTDEWQSIDDRGWRLWRLLGLKAYLIFIAINRSSEIKYFVV